MNTLHFAEVKSNAQQKPFLTYLVEEREWKSQMDSERDIMLEAVDHQGHRRPVLGSEALSTSLR